MRTTSFADDEKKYFEDTVNPVTLTSSDTQKHITETETFTAMEDFLAVKALKTASCDEIRREMLKAFNRDDLWRLVWQVAWRSGRTPKDWQT